MDKKYFRWGIAALTGLLLVSPFSGVEAAVDKDTIYQASSVSALEKGGYEGVVTISQLKAVGDIGVGTFAGLNGEMIMLDGEVYQALGNGKIVKPADSAKVAIATVTFMVPDYFRDVRDVDNMKQLKDALGKIIAQTGGPKNYYMVRIDGKFDKVLLRSEEAQQKPYRPLSKVEEKDLRVFKYQMRKGTVIGFYNPEGASREINRLGWHFHFIDDKRTIGGHLVDVDIDRAEIKLDSTTKFDTKALKD